ncbi:salt tolerance down-regulator-domain-containing protein [Parasitella parasitica]|nr:salt tolerance down-regulator-domain-containing protein [Parasitella parasitica]
MKQSAVHPIKVTTSSITIMKNAKNMCTTQKTKNTRWLVDKPERSDIWTNTNNTDERQRIREFWLQLSEEERRSLVKVEKDAVLRKMKEQQRHSCNCSVCGKKRTTIEDELEVLYDAYYEELEQYACRQQQNGIHSSDSHSEDEGDDDDDDGDDDDEDVDVNDYDDQEEDDDDNGDGYRSDVNEKEPHFSKTLTVKGSIITVADDLLKNDGKKFLDLIEKLDEKKTMTERQVANSHLFNEEDDDDDNDDDDDDDDQENGDDGSDVTDDEGNDAGSKKRDSRTEEQRMEEGRKMFQIFAARMFEQRVLTAYREKVAQDKQKRLIEELEEEDRQRQERERKKQQDKEKKKDKKRQLKLQQEQERLEAEKKRKEEELAAEAVRQQKAELERQKKEQVRLKRDQEKRQKEEERLRKEEERKKRRLKEEKAKAVEKERRRKEEEELKEKQRAEEKLNQERKRKLHNTKIPQQEEEEEEEGEEELSSPNTHHLLLDSSVTVDIIPNRRRVSVAGPIGSPIKSRPMSSHIASNDSANRNSFFSNFLFGPIQHNKTSDRRYSAGGDNVNTSLKWTNGWTPLTALSDNVHDKLFGDVLFKSSLILERAKLSYLKLDELAQIKYLVKPNYHPLIQLHQMLHELYHHHPDHVPVDPRELYEALNQPLSGFQCIQHQQHGYIIRLLDMSSTSPQPPPLLYNLI